MSTACAAFMPTATVLTLPSLLFTWRCRPGCGRIILRLQYDGRSIMEHKCGCDRWHRLPDDADNLRVEARR